MKKSKDGILREFEKWIEATDLAELIGRIHMTQLCESWHLDIVPDGCVIFTSVGSRGTTKRPLHFKSEGVEIQLPSPRPENVRINHVGGWAVDVQPWVAALRTRFEAALQRRKDGSPREVWERRLAERKAKREAVVA